MKKVMFFYRRLDYLKRHFSTFFPHLTLKKVINLILNEIEMRLAISAPKSLPPYIKVEPTPLCHLRCIGCEQSNANFKKQFNNSMNLTIENLKKIIEPISDTLVGVSLSLYGEPMLNKNIISMIEYIHTKNIGVSFPTNFSIKLNVEQIERIAKSGLDSIIISLDGASEETYSKYRVGGDFNLVLKNVKLLSDTKKNLGLKSPQIIWKFIVFDYNKHEVEIVKKTYHALGFDSYEFVFDFFGNFARNQKKVYKRSVLKKKKPCYWLWNTMIFRWNGIVRPCCSAIESKQFDLGNAIEENTKRIWQSEKYKILRESFNKKNYGQKMPPVCKKCLGLQVPSENP